MATVYQKTDNYALNLYGDNDPADLRDGYNNSMRTIDSTLENHLNKIEKAESEVQHDIEVVKALTGDGSVDSAKAAKAKWDATSTDVTAGKSKWDKGATDSAAAVNALTSLGSETTAKAAANKSKWDKGATDSAAAVNALTSLGSETTTKAAANKSKWDKAAEQAATIAATHVDSKLDSHFIVHAHRGSYRFPENTMEGILWAVEHGYVPEIDVQLTSDGVPVILHDTSTARTMSGAAINVSAMTYKDFMSREVKAKVHGGNTGKPVSMEQVLQAVGNRPVDFEIKSLTDATTDAMVALLEKYDVMQVHELTSFSWEQCVRAVNAGVKYVSWTWDTDAMPHSWADMKNNGIFCGNPREDKVTASMVSAAHNAGVKINPWLINDPVAYDKVANLSVDGITSNWPDYATRQICRNLTPFSTGQNVFMQPTRFQAFGQQEYVDISDADRAKSTYLGPDGLFQLGDADGQMAVELIEVGKVPLPCSIDIDGIMSRIQIGDSGDTRNIAVVAVKESSDTEPWADRKKAGQVGIIAGVRRNGATFGGFYRDNQDTVSFDATATKTPIVANDQAAHISATFVLDKDHARIIWAYSNGQNGDVTTGNNKNVTLPDAQYRLFLRVNRNFKSTLKIRVRPADGFMYES